MLSHLSAHWLIGLGALLCLLTLLLFRHIRKQLIRIFQPFKKGKTYWCKVITISDGDTLSCYRLNLRRSKTKLRFAYIDAPESSQRYGRESTRLIKQMVHGKLVRVKIIDVDRYGRCVGVIYRYRKSMNEEMIKRGAAWVYEDYIKDKKQLSYFLALQDQAKKHRKGLWRESRPVRPSTYRKQQKS